MSNLVNVQTALKPLKKSKKIEIIFFTLLGLAESFNTMNRTDPFRTGLTVTLFDGLFLGIYKR